MKTRIFISHIPLLIDIVQKPKPLAWHKTVVSNGHFDYSYGNIYQPQPAYLLLEDHIMVIFKFIIFTRFGKKKEKTYIHRVN